MTGVLSGVTTASSECFELLEKFEYAREGPPVVSGTRMIGGDSALDAVIRGPADFKNQAHSPPRY
jgi:hypothetical protein